MRGHAGGGDVDVGAAAVLVREHHPDVVDALDDAVLLVPDPAEEVVGVRDRDVALARHHRLDLVAVAALRRAGEVGEQPLGPGLRRLLAVVGDDRGHQRQVVDVRRGADADLALVGRIGQRLVGLRRARHPVLGVEDHPRALRQAVPVAVRVPKVLGDALGQHLRMHRLQQVLAIGEPDAAGVDGQEDVGRAVGALGLHPGDQLLRRALDAVDRDAGRLGEVAVERLVGVVVPGRVDVHLVGRGRQRGRGEGARQGEPKRMHVFPRIADRIRWVLSPPPPAGSTAIPTVCLRNQKSRS